MEKKRVYALYRVSTIGQVEKNDIPMQKRCCWDFAQVQGWDIIKEFSEKGVSGYKVSAKDRDAIRAIQEDALAGKFDILLVYMFDRLGRRDDETPFVVEWFVKTGIEVWSAMEGQQRFDSHVDKLMNYIRYWQASGESLKTSIRTKTRLGQLTEEGHYTGGTVPYGYRAVDKGRTNKKNQTVLDYEINEDEAAIVRLIFRKYVNEGFGARRLCLYLHDHQIQGRRGHGFPNTTLNRIIKNVMYIGIIKNGEAQSEQIEELRIIDDKTFSRAQEIMKERTMPHSTVPLNSKSKALLVGRIYCGHCGNRLTLTTSGSEKIRADGKKGRIWLRYQCHYNIRHPDECDGQSGYSVNKVDRLVEQVIRRKFQEIRLSDMGELVSEENEKQIQIAKEMLAQAQEAYQTKSKNLEDIRMETYKVIRGESKLNAELLNSLAEEATGEAELAEKALQEAKDELKRCEESTENLENEYNQLLSWADLYDGCTMEAKKMIVAQLIKSVYIFRDYRIQIEFNINFDGIERIYQSTGYDEPFPELPKKLPRKREVS